MCVQLNRERTRKKKQQANYTKTEKKYHRYNISATEWNQFNFSGRLIKTCFLFAFSFCLVQFYFPLLCVIYIFYVVLFITKKNIVRWCFIYLFAYLFVDVFCRILFERILIENNNWSEKHANNFFLHFAYIYHLQMSAMSVHFDFSYYKYIFLRFNLLSPG